MVEGGQQAQKEVEHGGKRNGAENRDHNGDLILDGDVPPIIWAVILITPMTRLYYLEPCRFEPWQHF